jgi:hypothetical protein
VDWTLGKLQNDAERLKEYYYRLNAVTWRKPQPVPITAPTRPDLERFGRFLVAMSRLRGGGDRRRAR